MSLYLEAPNKGATQWVKYAKDDLRIRLDRAIKLESHGAKVRSDTGLVPYRDRDEAAQLTNSGAAELFDFRAGSIGQYGMTALLRPSIYGRLAGYEDVNPSAPRPNDSASIGMMPAKQKRTGVLFGSPAIGGTTRILPALECGR